MSGAVIGLDLGGANLKAAHSAGYARTRPFPLWQSPDRLAPALAALLGELPPAGLLAVTMTGELCDCFASKRAGVLFLLDAVARVADGRPVLVWCLDGRLAPPEQVGAEPLRAAAANWLALATEAARLVPHGRALLFDVGSTTTDLIPLLQGRPVPRGHTDPERLRSGELVYTGVTRTPLCALLGGEGAAELFATTRDVYLLLGRLAEDPSCRLTADGRPATREASHARLARMLCADVETSSAGERLALARELARRQRRLIAAALHRVGARLGGPPETVILSGSGAFLAADVLDEEEGSPQRISLAREWGPELSEAACAYAVARLARERGA